MHRVSWDDVEQYVQDVKKTFGKDKLTGVYGIPRGGLVLAVMISHELGIPVLMAACDGCLVVDDICDTGQTLKHYQSRYKTSTMFKADNSPFEPDHWLFEKTNEWIEYPWE